MTNPVMLTVSSITPIHAEPAVLEVHMSRAMTVAEINTLFERLSMALMASAAEPTAECPHCREVYEIWAGIEGFIPATAPEAYQQRIIDQMREAAARGLSVKNRT